MQEHERPTPEQIFALKDELVDRWNKLPTEHQATLVLTLVRDLMEGEWGAWLGDALAYQQGSPADLALNELVVKFSVTRDDLRSIRLTDEEIAQLTDDDLAIVARTMRDRYIHRVFFDDLASITAVVLEDNRRTAQALAELEGRTSTE